jgi:hypothetical protein
MNSRLLITLLCAGAVALACGSLARTDVTQNVARHSDNDSAISKATRVNGNFIVNVEPHVLRFAFNVKNESSKHVELDFPNGQQVEFSVRDSVGREVYRWSTGRMFTQSVQNRLIDGGDSVRYDERIDATLPRGKYIAIATLRSTNFPMTEKSEFQLR